MNRLHAITCFCSLLALTACATSNPNFELDAYGNIPATYQMQAAQADAQAAAIRAGDDKLTCTQLQAEMTALTNDPAYQAGIASTLANAETQTGVADAAQANATAMAALGVVGALPVQIPGMEWVNLAAANATKAHMNVQGARSQAALTSTFDGMAGMQASIWRQQRVMELAGDKNCAFMQEAAAY